MSEKTPHHHPVPPAKLDPKKKKKAWMWAFLWMVMPFTAFFKLEELLGGEDEDAKYNEFRNQQKSDNTQDSGE